MTQDPYAAPQSNIQDSPSGPGSPGTGTFDIGLAMSDGWKNTISNLGPVLGVTFVGLIVSSLMYVTIIGIFLGIPVLAWGASKFLLNTHDGRCDFGDLFSGFSNYGHILGRMLLFMLLVLVIFVVGASIQYIGMFMESPGITLIGSLINLVFQLIVGVRLLWAGFYVVDRDLAPMDAVKASWSATQGNWLKLFLLSLMMVVVTFLGLLALIVGIFVAIPVTQFMSVSSYRQCTGTPAS